MKRGPASNSFTASKIDQSQDELTYAVMFSTDAEEIFVEIIWESFTKLLQTYIYNTLHT